MKEEAVAVERRVTFVLKGNSSRGPEAVHRVLAARSSLDQGRILVSQGFSSIAKPITQLTQKSASFVWTEACETSFVELKMILTSAPVIYIPSVSPNLSIPTVNDRSSHSYNSSDIPIFGPCNGLVCIALGENVFLCNPALREFKMLPPIKFPEHYYKAPSPLGYGFGFEELGGVYKVIRIWDVAHIWLDDSEYMYDSDNDVHEIRVDLYDSVSNSWKQIEANVPDFSESPSIGFFFNGLIHWYAVTDHYYIVTDREDRPFILCFDISSETFLQLDFHDGISPRACGLNLMEFDGSLAMVFCEEPSVIEIWVMKEYGDKESWTKQFVISTLILKNEWLVFETNKSQLAACTIYGVRDLWNRWFVECSNL
ncbi:F-box/kelch-repeat protein At3g06240-like [Henckelia pumila]|uniref:F-box/kelch-repeat protein At3g06240-like n=1 Tax=Henckelia pumila TaxID=405737 RepID=UPI003C6E058A